MRALTPFLLLIAACGGGGGPSLLSELRGQLSVLAAQAQRAQPATPARPETLAAAHVTGVEPEGRLEQAGRAVFRYVATTSRTLAATADGEVDVVLFNLATGEAGRGVAVVRGDPFDVVVSGTGDYRVRLEEGAAEPASLPEGYVEYGDGHVPGEIVVGAEAGVAPATLAALVDADWVRGDGVCLLRLRGEPDADPLRELCRVLCCCARLEDLRIARYDEPNYYRRLAQAPDDPRYAEQWALEQARFPAAWTLTTGSEQVVVGVIDSGTHAGHPDLAGRVLAGYDFVDDDADVSDPTPTLAHGTSTAGIIAAATNNGVGVAGANWDARIVPLRAFNESGLGTSFRISNSILFAAGLPNASGTTANPPARVLNLSFASGIPSVAEQDACADARQAGALPIAASGNDGRTVQQYPAAYPSVMAVGATTSDGKVASYSNTGAWIDIVAPGGSVANGVLVISRVGGAYTYLKPNGTSFAAPHVAGAAALALSANPALTVDELEQLLLDSAQDIDAVGYDTRSGHGLVDAFAAVSLALALPEPTLIPGELVHVQLVQVSTGKVVFTTSTTQAASLVFAIAGVGAGEYTLRAGTDRDFDGDVDDPGEVGGQWFGPGNDPVVRVFPPTDVGNLDFVILPK